MRLPTGRSRSSVTARHLYPGDLPRSGKSPGSTVVGCVSVLPAPDSERVLLHMSPNYRQRLHVKNTTTTCIRESLKSLINLDRCRMFAPVSIPAPQLDDCGQQSFDSLSGIRRNHENKKPLVVMERASPEASGLYLRT